MSGAPSWVEGLPTKDGLYWLAGEDQGGWPCVSLFRLEYLSPVGSPAQPFKGVPPEEMAEAMQAYLAALEPVWTRIDIAGCASERSAPWKATHYCAVAMPLHPSKAAASSPPESLS